MPNEARFAVVAPALVSMTSVAKRITPSAGNTEVARGSLSVVQEVRAAMAAMANAIANAELGMRNWASPLLMRNAECGMRNWASPLIMRT